MDRSLRTPALPGSGQGTGAAIRFHLSREWLPAPLCSIVCGHGYCIPKGRALSSVLFSLSTPLLYVPFEWVHDWILLDTCRPAWYPEDDFLYTLHNPSGGLSMKKLQFAMVGGGNGALIGDIHRIGAQFDDLAELKAG